MEMKKITGDYSYESVKLRGTVPVVMLSAAKHPRVPTWRFWANMDASLRSA